MNLALELTDVSPVTILPMEVKRLSVSLLCVRVHALAIRWVWFVLIAMV
jgi:hypothetical protein